MVASGLSLSGRSAETVARVYDGSQTPCVQGLGHRVQGFGTQLCTGSTAHAALGFREMQRANGA